MAVSGFLFLSWRVFEIVITTPIVGMLGWFVHNYTRLNLLTPTYILVLFIVSTLALAWVVFTMICYLRARHDALLVAFFDLGFVGAFIGGVVVLRYIANRDCGNFNAGITTQGSWLTYNLAKKCAMQKASFALGIIDCLLFFVSFLLALLVHRNHRDDDRVVVKREYSHGGRHGHRRSGSREYRSSRDDYRPRSSGRSHYSRRQYYV